MQLSIADGLTVYKSAAITYISNSYKSNVYWTSIANGSCKTEHKQRRLKERSTDECDFAAPIYVGLCSAHVLHGVHLLRRNTSGSVCGTLWLTNSGQNDCHQHDARNTTDDPRPSPTLQINQPISYLSVLMTIFSSGRGLASTRMFPFWIVLQLRITEVVVTSAAIRCAKLQSNRHHQQTNHSAFYRLVALPTAQPTASEH